MIVQRERPDQSGEIRRVTAAAFAGMPHSRTDADGVPTEARLVDELRASDAWIPALSLVAVRDDAVRDDAVRDDAVRDDAVRDDSVRDDSVRDDAVIGHVVCSRGHVGDAPALGLGPLSVHPEHQRRGVGSALVHAVLGAADALDEPLVVLLGNPAYYGRFGFRPADALGVTPPVPEWAGAFLARPLTAYRPDLRGVFRYAEPFDRV